MKRHVDLLAWLYLTWGAIFALVAIAGAALAAGAVAIATTTGALGFSSETAAQVTAFTIGLLAVLAAVWGVLHLWIGRALGRYVPRRGCSRLGSRSSTWCCCRSARRSASTRLGAADRRGPAAVRRGGGSSRSPPASTARI